MEDKKAGKVPDLKLFNVLVQYDIYIAAHSQEEAEAAILGVITQGEPPMEVIKYQVRSQRDIRTDWKGERPFVSGEVSDEEWMPFTGKTTEEFFDAVSQLRGH